MNDQEHINLTDSDIDFDFLKKEPPKEATRQPELKKASYKILISDDDDEIHKMTKLVLKGFRMEGVGIEFLDAYSGKETIEILNKVPDIAVVLLDVVMEEPDSGLKVVRYIRETLGNNLTRLILRTGQPGVAPEEKVIVDYEIDDYKAKSELTVQKLMSTMYVCLRAYKNIKALDRHRKGLRRVIHASHDLFKYHSFTEFLNGMLQQVIALYDVEVDSFYVRDERYTMNGMAFVKILDSAKVLAGTGKFEKIIGQSIDIDTLPKDLRKLIMRFENTEDSEMVIREGRYLGIYKQNFDKLVKNYIVLEADVSNENIELIKLFLTNFSLAIDNFVLNVNANETQKEIIFRVSEVVENRANDSTGQHLKRVSKITELLAKNLGFEKDMIEAVTLASVMHGVGKIGIKDSILLKPGKLTKEEFDEIKTHTTIGYNILKDSKLPVLKLAAKIALHHHERFDGKGYPAGCSGTEIPKECAIVAVADVFDALLSKRCYKDKWKFEDVISYFEKERGHQFTPEVVDALMDNLDQVYEIIEAYPD
ncbi:MAG TPA: DUF3369 domain-containing protein [Lachnospiraceae bacterium]|nr:DUF3369 domain-containing protein [Lachnospiraceae bacterium]